MGEGWTDHGLVFAMPDGQSWNPDVRGGCSGWKTLTPSTVVATIASKDRSAIERSLNSELAPRKKHQS